MKQIALMLFALIAGIAQLGGARATPLGACGNWDVDFDTTSAFGDYDPATHTCSYELNFLSGYALGTPVSLTVNPSILDPGQTVFNFTTFDVGTLNNNSGFVINAVAVAVTTIDHGTMAMFVGPFVGDPFAQTIVAPGGTGVTFTGPPIPGMGGAVNIAFAVTVPAGFQGTFAVSQALTNVPEPGTLALLALGLAGVAAISRRKFVAQ